MPNLVPPVATGSEFDETVWQQWFETVRRLLNQPPVISSTVNPTTADVPEGTWVVWDNTTINQVRVWANNGGVMISVQLV